MTALPFVAPFVPTAPTAAQEHQQQQQQQHDCKPPPQGLTRPEVRP